MYIAACTYMYAMLVRLHVEHPIQDLEDVRSTMAALDEVRAVEIEMDMELGPIEECYSFLQRCGVAVPREEMERVDSLRYTFKNLQAQSVSSSDTVLCMCVSGLLGGGGVHKEFPEEYEVSRTCTCSLHLITSSTSPPPSPPEHSAVSPGIPPAPVQDQSTGVCGGLQA